MIVQDGHDASLPERGNNSFVGVSGRPTGSERVLLNDLRIYAVHSVDVHAGGRRRARECLGERDVGIQCVIDRIRETHAVEPLGGHEVGDVAHRLLVQTLGRIGLEVTTPVNAPELHAVAVGVEDPSRGGFER